MTDVTSGFRAANRRPSGVFADHYPAEYLGDTVESLVIAVRAGCTVTPGAGLDAGPLRRAGQPDPPQGQLYLVRASSRWVWRSCASGRPRWRT